MQWAGLRGELELAVAGWRGLPDNPLWLVASRQAAVSRQRTRTSRLFIAAAIGGLLVLAYAGTCYFMWAINSTMGGGLGLSQYLQVLSYGFVLPCAAIYLLVTLSRVGLNAQSWLGVERTDAKRMQVAMLDPLLSLTPLGPHEVLFAALRELLPQVWLASAVASCALGFIDLTSTFDGDQFPTVLLLLPLTVGGYLVTGALGGLAVVLLLFSLGLNSTTQGQRAFPALLLVLHQLVAFGTGFASLLSLEALHDQRALDPLAGVLGALLLIGSIWLGARLALSISRLSMTWLLLTPLGITFGYWILLGLSQLASIYGGGLDSSMSFLMAVAMHLAGAWASLSLFVSGAFMTGQSFGITDSELGLQQVYRFALIVLTQVGLIAVLYRTALEAAYNRLRSQD
jgi:hypothetical protein